MGICKDLQGFTRLWERIHKDSWGFLRIHKILGEERIFGRGFVGICKDLQGFTRLWERIHKDS